MVLSTEQRVLKRWIISWEKKHKREKVHWWLQHIKGTAVFSLFFVFF